MSFVRLMRERALGAGSRVAVCLSGTSDEWSRISDWWTPFVADEYSLDVFGHVIGDSAITNREFKRVTHGSFDALALVNEMAERKRFSWDTKKPITNADIARDAYALLHVSSLKRSHELELGFDYRWCIHGKPNVKTKVADFQNPESNAVYGNLFSDHAIKEFDPSFFYADSRTFDIASTFYRSLSVMRHEHIAPDFWDIERPDEFSAGAYFFFHLNMYHLKPVGVECVG